MLRSKIKLRIVLHLTVFFVHVLPLACASSFQAPGLLRKGLYFFTALFLILKCFYSQLFMQSYLSLPENSSTRRSVSLDRQL